ncbi:bestrophin family protein [Falsirhodobacter sp. 1013]|uniref:bestrophin family protein n=1 Tax=Falsirhodobacter sp. 1013 TaxID=3417566 RepID=UPI003EB9844D
MITRRRPHPKDVLFAVRGSILPRIWWRVVLVGAAALVTMLVDRWVIPLQHPSTAAFGAFGVALSLFLGFRNNAAYNRWWEGRTLIGLMMADIRAFAREVQIMVPSAPARAEIIGLAEGYMHLTRLFLRRLSLDEAARAALGPHTDLADAIHPPCAALDRIADRIAALDLNPVAQRALTERLGLMTQHQTGCERLALTPLPFAYSLLIYRTTWLYCLLIPLSLIEAAGWMTPFFAATIAYVFMGLAEVTEELVEPFGHTENALPLDAICTNVGMSVAPHLGRTPPPVPAAKDHYLS